MLCYKSEEDPLYEAARKYPIAAKRFMGWTEEAIREFILAERRIMKDEKEIESLIVSTVGKIKTALDNDKPGEAKVYTEMLVLLRETLSHSLETQKRMELFDKTYSKPFKEISDKHNPNV